MAGRKSFPGPAGRQPLERAESQEKRAAALGMSWHLNCRWNSLLHRLTGFKAQSVNFSDLVYQNLTQGSAGTTGGTDPIQIGSGAQVASISPNLQQGTLQQTGNEYDMAIQGSGYFVVNSDAQDDFTRAGSFGVDANGYLVDPATGARVQRFGTIGEGCATSPAFQIPNDDDIQIPTGVGVPGSATSSITLQGNLSATSPGPVAQVLTSAQPFTIPNPIPNQPPQAATLTTPLSNLSDNILPYGNGADTIVLNGVDAAGNAVTNVPVTVGPSGNPPSPATMQTLITAIQGAFQGTNVSLDGSGNLVLTSTTTGPSKLSLTITDGTNADGGATNWGNHAMAVTTGADGATVNTSVQIYDPQGSAHTLNLVFQKQGNNTWNLTGSVNANEGTMVNNLDFNQNGSFGQVGGNATMSVQFNGFAAPQQLSFNFGNASGFNGVTQEGGASSAAAIGQNGFANGSLSTVSVDHNGVLNGIFTNGQTLAIAQLAIANFANPAALTRTGNNYFSLSTESGPALIGAGNTGGNGSVQQGQLESSNVDVSLEFTRLIIAQQGYQVNAHVITAADQILQDLGNIIR